VVGGGGLFAQDPEVGCGEQADGDALGERQPDFGVTGSGGDDNGVAAAVGLGLGRQEVRAGER